MKAFSFRFPFFRLEIYFSGVQFIFDQVFECKPLVVGCRIALTTQRASGSFGPGAHIRFAIIIVSINLIGQACDYLHPPELFHSYPLTAAPLLLLFSQRIRGHDVEICKALGITFLPQPSRGAHFFNFVFKYRLHLCF